MGKNILFWLSFVIYNRISLNAWSTFVIYSSAILTELFFEDHVEVNVHFYSFLRKIVRASFVRSKNCCSVVNIAYANITINDKHSYITNIIIIIASIDYYTIALTMIFIMRSAVHKFWTLSSLTTFLWIEIDTMQDPQNLASPRTRNKRGEFIFHEQIIYLFIVYAD